jgi:hypothetical protein
MQRTYNNLVSRGRDPFAQLFTYGRQTRFDVDEYDLHTKSSGLESFDSLSALDISLTSHDRYFLGRYLCTVTNDDEASGSLALQRRIWEFPFWGEGRGMASLTAPAAALELWAFICGEPVWVAAGETVRIGEGGGGGYGGLII